MPSDRTPEPAPEPYRTVGQVARFYKALLQMFIGVGGAAVIVVRLFIDLFGRHLDAAKAGQNLFVNIGLTLGIAAVVELAYTLFTHGADEAVEPVMLGLAAALLVQLGQVGIFDFKQGIAALLFVIALGGMFVVRNRLAHVVEPPGWSPKWWARFQHPAEPG